MGIAALSMLLASVSAPPIAMPPVEPIVSAIPIEGRDFSAPQTAPVAAAPQTAPVAAAPQDAPAPQDDIVIVARPKSDPLAAVNEQTFAATQAIDRAVVGPLAKGFERIVPDPIRSGFRNVLYTLREPIVAVNFMLQHKPGKAAETVCRLAINLTLGVGGLFDIAKRKPFHLPRRRNNFADTLGFYGVGPGPYLFLPLVGSTTVRDLVGGVVDGVVIPLPLPTRRLVIGGPLGVVGTLDRRAENDGELTRERASPSGAYVAARTYYLASREAEIQALRGKPRATAPTIPAK